MLDVGKSLTAEQRQVAGDRLFARLRDPARRSGIEVSFAGTDAAGCEWLFDVSGAFSSRYATHPDPSSGTLKDFTSAALNATVGTDADRSTITNESFGWSAGFFLSFLAWVTAESMGAIRATSHRPSWVKEAPAPLATVAAVIVLLPGLSFTTALAELSMRHLAADFQGELSGSDIASLLQARSESEHQSLQLDVAALEGVVGQALIREGQRDQFVHPAG